MQPSCSEPPCVGCLPLLPLESYLGWSRARPGQGGGSRPRTAAGRPGTSGSSPASRPSPLLWRPGTLADTWEEGVWMSREQAETHEAVGGPAKAMFSAGMLGGSPQLGSCCAPCCAPCPQRPCKGRRKGAGASRVPWGPIAKQNRTRARPLCGSRLAQGAWLLRVLPGLTMTGPRGAS